MSLYRQILRVHRDKLPGPMRPLGDSYAREEFAQHLKGKTTTKQWQEFGKEWQRYLGMLRGKAEADQGTDTSHLFESMTEDQKRKLEELREEISNLGRGMGPKE